MPPWEVKYSRFFKKAMAFFTGVSSDFPVVPGEEQFGQAGQVGNYSVLAQVWCKCLRRGACGRYHGQFLASRGGQLLEGAEGRRRVRSRSACGARQVLERNAELGIMLH